MSYETIAYSGDKAMTDLLQRRGVGLHGRSFLARVVILEPPSELIDGLNSEQPTRIGAFTYSWSHIPRPVRSVGRYCSIAAGVTFAEMQHPTTWLSTSSFTYENDWIWSDFAKSRGQVHTPAPWGEADYMPPITIGHDVWIGSNAYIRGGITLGTGCIVGAHAVVTRSVPPYAIVVGNPARIVRYRFPDDVVAALLRSRWWDYAFPDFMGPHITDVPAALAHIERLVAQDAIKPYRPTRIRLVAPAYLGKDDWPY